MMIEPSGTVKEGVAISMRGTELVIERQWFDRDRTVPATSRAVLFNVFLVCFLYMGSSLFSTPIPGTVLPVVAVFFILLATGICVAYGVATDWLNRTVIVVNRATISVRHGPLPWPGSKVVSAAGIVRIHAVMSSLVKSVRRRRLYTFDFIAETADGQRTKIAGGFREPEAARQAMEKYLSIKPAKPTPPDAAERDRQTIDNFLSGKPLEQPIASAAARTSNGPPTTLSAVMAYWLFILLWNGLIWWYIRFTASTEGTAILWDNIALLSPLVLIGLGLIYAAIPRTIRFFREWDRTQKVGKWGKKEWAFVAVIAWFGLIALTFYWMAP
jgi:hypothetical protein